MQQSIWKKYVTAIENKKICSLKELYVNLKPPGGGEPLIQGILPDDANQMIIEIVLSALPHGLLLKDIVMEKFKSALKNTDFPNIVAFVTTVAKDPINIKKFGPPLQELLHFIESRKARDPFTTEIKLSEYPVTTAIFRKTELEDAALTLKLNVSEIAKLKENYRVRDEFMRSKNSFIQEKTGMTMERILSMKAYLCWLHQGVSATMAASLSAASLMAGDVLKMDTATLKTKLTVSLIPVSNNELQDENLRKVIASAAKAFPESAYFYQTITSLNLPDAAKKFINDNKITTFAPLRKKGMLAKITTEGKINKVTLVKLRAYVYLELLSINYSLNQALIGKGLVSSYKISRRPLNKFLTEFKVYAKPEELERIHSLASAVTTKNLPIAIWRRMVASKSYLDKVIQGSSRNESYFIIGSSTSGAADDDSCQCSHCTSVLSPAAYLEGLLGFIETYFLDSGGAPVSPEYLFGTRMHRPSLLMQSRLDCDLVEQPLPHIQIVIGALLDFIKTEIHVGMDVDEIYDELSQSLNPAPFYYQGVRFREYLTVLGTTLIKNHDLFADPTTDNLTITHLAEKLHISGTELAKLTGTSLNLNDLANVLGLTSGDLTAILAETVPESKLEKVANCLKQSTTDLEILLGLPLVSQRIENIDINGLDKLWRFIFLNRIFGTTVKNLGKIFTALNYTVVSISEVNQLYKIMCTACDLNLTLVEFTPFLADEGNTGLENLLDLDPAELAGMIASPTLGKLSIVFGVSYGEIMEMLQFMAIPLDHITITTTHLNKIYRISKLAKSLQVKVKELILLMQDLSLNDLQPLNLLLNVLKIVQEVKRLGIPWGTLLLLFHTPDISFNEYLGWTSEELDELIVALGNSSISEVERKAKAAEFFGVPLTDFDILLDLGIVDVTTSISGTTSTTDLNNINVITNTTRLEKLHRPLRLAKLTGVNPAELAIILSEISVDFNNINGNVYQNVFAIKKLTAMLNILGLKITELPELITKLTAESDLEASLGFAVNEWRTVYGTAANNTAKLQLLTEKLGINVETLENLINSLSSPINLDNIDVVDSIRRLARISLRLKITLPDLFQILDLINPGQGINSVDIIDNFLRICVLGIASGSLMDILTETGLNTFTNITSYDHVYWLYSVRTAAESLTLSVTQLGDLNLWEHEVLESNVENLLDLLKARYNEAQYNKELEKPNERINQQVRDALREYACKHYSAPLTVQELSSTLLIDLETAPGILTTQIQQAIESAQTFITRVRTGREENIRMTTDENGHRNMEEEWRWLRQYVLWEAAMKVFLYPENYIMPQLRDDKSQFFKEMEDELSQGEVTDALAEKAIKGYIEKLHAISALRILGTVYDQENDLIHIFAKSQVGEKETYHRTLKYQSVWSPWEKLDLEINTEKVYPFIAYNRVYLFWINTETEEKDNSIRFKHKLFLSHTLDSLKWLKPQFQQLTNNLSKFSDLWVQISYRNNNVYITVGPYKMTNGLNYSYYDTKEADQLSEYWYQLPDFDNIKPVRKGCTDNFNLNIEQSLETKDIAIQYTGFIDIPIDGEYTFYVKDDAGSCSQLFIGDGSIPLVDNSTLSSQERSGKINLLRGRHSIKLTFFSSIIYRIPNIINYIGPYDMKVYYEGPNIKKSEIPTNILFRPLFINEMKSFEEYRLICNDVFENTPDSLELCTEELVAFITDEDNINEVFYDELAAGVILFGGSIFSTTNVFFPLNDALQLQNICNYDSVAKTRFYKCGNENQGILNYCKLKRFGEEDYDETFLNSIECKFIKVNKNSEDCYYTIFMTDKTELKYLSIFKDKLCNNFDILGFLFGQSYNLFSEMEITIFKNIDPSSFKIESIMQVGEDIYLFCSDQYRCLMIHATIGENTCGTCEISFKIHQLNYGKYCKVVDKLLHEGVDAFYDPAFQKSQGLTPTLGSSYGGVAPEVIYQPPTGLEFEGPNKIYNWELFFHIPHLIADQLSQNRNFELASKWYHYIMNPYTGSPEVEWRFAPFTDSQIQQLEDYIHDPEDAAVWREDPFTPHAIARVRPGAYQKAVILSYIDNLLEWADQEFTRDTRESINQAREMYLLTEFLLKLNEIEQEQPCDRLMLGIQVAIRAAIGSSLIEEYDLFNKLEELKHFSKENIQRLHGVILSIADSDQNEEAKAESISNLLDDLLENQENAETRSDLESQLESILEEAEAYSASLEDNPTVAGQASLEQAAIRFLAGMMAGCIPENPIFETHRNRIESNLRKIRSGRNIAGVQRILPMFEASIDPMAVVKAVAGGGDLGTLNFSNANGIGPYRFAYLIERAKVLAGMVAQAGNALLAALEKKESEEMAFMRARQELKLAKANVHLRKLGVAEAEDGLDLTTLQTERAEFQYNYFNDLIINDKNQFEKDALKCLEDSIRLLDQAKNWHLAAAIASLIPNYNFKGFIKESWSWGGSNLAGFASGFAAMASIDASKYSTRSSIASMNASYERRKEEWTFQRNLATKDKAISLQNEQIAQDRIAIAEMEQQIAEMNAEFADQTLQFLKEKFTNKELYAWMVKILSKILYGFYNLAYTTARMAQATLEFERNETLDFISYAYWDSERKGLLSGDQLLLDINRMDDHYVKNNARKLEITKHFSLAANTPEALIELKSKGKAIFATPIACFDRDFPGHYQRLIKSARVSVLALIGPGTGMNATLSTVSPSRIILDPGNPVSIEIQRIQSVALSAPSNASGLFELNYRDERYLPFEGCGVDVLWQLEMPKPSNRFDFNSIVDVILTIDYTALADSEFKNVVTASLGTNTGGMLPLSVKTGFPDTWYHFHNPIWLKPRAGGGDPYLTSGTPAPYTFKIEVSCGMFPPNEENQTMERAALRFSLSDASLRLPIKVKYQSQSGQTFEGNYITGAEGYLPLEGLQMSPFGIWEITVNRDSAPEGLWVKNSDGTPVFENITEPGTNHRVLNTAKINDLVLAVTYRAELQWPED